jgi:labile enterotoxin output A
MNSTLAEFKNQQDKAMQILKRLQEFLIEGEEYGISIDESIKTKLANALKNVQDGKLKIALVGGFSEGKTSIAAAWLEKLDKTSMKISHEESSDEVKIYNVDDEIELVDTPGLFGFKEKFNDEAHTIQKYKDITKKYVSEAHLVLYVLNPVNPIKQSHESDLNWLFRELNLLPRTIFVLSKFDEVADIEDEVAYKSEFNIKKQNVIERLCELIKLTQNEINELSIVAVSANPFDNGIEYWIENLAEFKKLSHISNLQEATSAKIKTNGGIANIVNESKKSVIADVINKQLPVARGIQQEIAKNINSLNDTRGRINGELMPLASKISKIRVELREFITGYFSDIILQAQGTSIDSFNDFFQREIGSEGINMNTRIQNEFDKLTNSVNRAISRLEVNFQAEVDNFNSTLLGYGKQGVSCLQKTGMINANNIKMARDGIVSAARLAGVDLSSILKFKPWGAINLASRLNAVFAVLGFVLEMWDSIKRKQEEAKFTKDVKDMVNDFEKQRKEILNLINGDNFIDTFFPDYIKLASNLEEIEKDIETMKETQANFKKWLDVGETIDAEFEVIR